MRLPVKLLSLSAAGLLGLILAEGYTDRAIIPTAGDKPTVGFGSTYRDDGKPVALGDTITPPVAVQRSVRHIQRDEVGLKRCVTGALTQGEYDILVDFAYQYGVPKTCASSMVRHINSGRYRDACEAYRAYRFSQGRDCSLPQHWGPHGCKGVWLRNQERAEKCLFEQEQ